MNGLGVEGAASALRRRAAWLLVALLVASVFNVAQPGAERGAAAECVPVPISAFGSPPLVTTPGAQCFLVTTTNSGPYLIKTGDAGFPTVIGPGEFWVQPEYFTSLDGFTRYRLQANTTYRVETSEPTFAVYNPASSDGCTALDDTTWSTKGVSVQVDGDEVACRSFQADPGRVVRLGLARDTESSVFDGDGDFVCGGEAVRSDDSAECRLDRGSGPYRVLLVDVGAAPGSAVPLSVVDTASTQGCSTVQATPWSTALASYPRWASGRWQCFRIDPASTGRHLLSFLAESRWATYELWHVGVGRIRPSGSSETALPFLQDLTDGESYRYVLKGNPRPDLPGYHFGYFDLGDDSGCRPPLDVRWEATPARGTSPLGGLDCYAVTADPGDRYRLQLGTPEAGETPGAFVVDATGANPCAASAGGGCRFQGQAPYRVLVGQGIPGADDPSARTARYAVTFTDIASPGCETGTPLATFNQPLPLVVQGADDGTTYHCFRLSTSAAASYRFSHWAETGAGGRTYELWRAGADQAAPGAGLVRPERVTTLLPHTEYVLVAAGSGPGEYRAGLYDVDDGPGCITVTDVSWSAPALTGSVGHGALDCHEVMAAAGDRYRLEWQSRTELRNVDGSVCDATCVVPAPTRLRAITDAGDGAHPYRFWINELADTGGCTERLDATAPLADPLVAQVGPLETRCFVVDTRGIGLQGWSNSADSNVIPYVVSTLGERCDLWIEHDCGFVEGRRIVVMRNPDSTPTRSAVLLRETDFEQYKEACEPLTAQGFRGEFGGQFDEECFTFALPAGTKYNMSAVGTSGSAQPFALVFGNGETCQNFFCNAPGGTQVMRVINAGEGPGSYRVELAGIRATFDLGPYLVGKPKVGSRLRVVYQGTSPDDAKVSVRWLRDGKAVRSGLGYRVRPRDRGHVIRPRVTISAPGFQTDRITLEGVRIRRR